MTAWSLWISRASAYLKGSHFQIRNIPPVTALITTRLVYYRSPPPTCRSPPHASRLIAGGLWHGKTVLSLARLFAREVRLSVRLWNVKFAVQRIWLSWMDVRIVCRKGCLFGEGRRYAGGSVVPRAGDSLLHSTSCRLLNNYIGTYIPIYCD